MGSRPRKCGSRVAEGARTAPARLATNCSITHFEERVAMVLVAQPGRVDHLEGNELSEFTDMTRRERPRPR